MIPSGQFVGFALLEEEEEEEFEPRMTPITRIRSPHGGCLQGRKLSDHDYKGHRLRQTYKPDFICFDKIVVELKAASELTDEHRAQVHNYLRKCFRSPSPSPTRK